jgi:hypothetical protein
MSRESDPIEVLSDLLGGEGFEIADTRLAAVLLVQGLRDAGFSLVPNEPSPKIFDEVLGEIGRMRTEIDRLQEAHRRALQLANEWARAANLLRLELTRVAGQRADSEATGAGEQASRQSHYSP